LPNIKEYGLENILGLAVFKGYLLFFSTSK
jgi:hypothetical protein